MKKKAPRGHKRVHDVVVRLVFDRPCTRDYALDEAGQDIYGDHYTGGCHEDGEPETFTVRVLRKHR